MAAIWRDSREVERVLPEAAHLHPDRYKMVNYLVLGITQPSVSL